MDGTNRFGELKKNKKLQSLVVEQWKKYSYRPYFHTNKIRKYVVTALAIKSDLAKRFSKYFDIHPWLSRNLPKEKKRIAN